MREWSHKKGSADDGTGDVRPDVEESMKKSERPKTEPSTSSLVRGLLVLESFTREKQSYSLTNLSKSLGIPKSSLHRVVKDLSLMNYLRYEEQSRCYYLGTRILSLGFSLLRSMELREIARPYLEKLSREFNKTVNLAVFDRDEMVYVERIRVPGLRAFNISVGARLPVWNTAVGKVVLAYLATQRLKELLEKSKSFPGFKISEHRLMNELAEIRKNGFALNEQEFNRGILAVAAPVFSDTGVVCAVNMIAEPEDASIDTLREQYAPGLMAVARELSKALGYQE